MAVAASEKYHVIGFDINTARIAELNNKYDRTGEVDSEALEKSNTLLFSNHQEDLVTSNFYIVTAPTPIDKNNNPDLSLLQSAS